MNPTLIHRYTIPLQQAIEQLVGKEATDGESFLVDIDGDDLIIDIHGPANVTFRVGDYEYTVDGRGGQEATNETPKNNVAAPEPEATPAEPPRKGGPLAQRAAISCGEKGFWIFIGKKFGVTIGSADEAAAWLKAQCGVKSRVDLDYDEAKADNFRGIDKAYRLWLEGYD
ncbi:MAG: hypothetical protein E5Y10_21900 [Mesorhizobium sp.]|uniref:hypothetical protein n=1 Tax=Mesorhizobium sp. TaxID=1871066 RepID=UPI00122ACEF0|nr:hypothetical protein [Mesorhizobium sp.]TIN36786.1 MAG: hypothetical protein E5Y13_22510 [Mesorhizobium sp.]TJU86631.1 MAG: hypothetical protein E5Y10_21900 [Mesorhizobium sp.]